jgi:ribulose-5-phosphate 4-epimerase/fuculose-1-phosphate aldolase
MKELMEDYVGVKFETLRMGSEIRPDLKDVFPHFSRNGQRLRRFGMTPKNAGNMSVRAADGMVITASGANLGSIEDREIVYVQRCSVEDRMVEYVGQSLPSSETFMHFLVYRSRSEARAIVHAHDPATSALEEHDVKETAREEPYGTLELARIACETFSKKERIIVLKNHGYVAIGDTLSQAVDRIIEVHVRLIQGAVRR